MLDQVLERCDTITLSAERKPSLSFPGREVQGYINTGCRKLPKHELWRMAENISSFQEAAWAG